MFKIINLLIMFFLSNVLFCCAQDSKQESFRFSKYVNIVSNISYVSAYPDSDYVVDNIVRINDNILFIPIYDINENQSTGETGFVIAKDSDYYAFENLKEGRKGQQWYLGSKNNLLFIVFDCFVENSRGLSIYSDSPPYSKLFNYSELWMINLNNYDTKKIDTDEGEYQNIEIKKSKVIFEIHGKYKKEIYFD